MTPVPFDVSVRTSAPPWVALGVMAAVAGVTFSLRALPFLAAKLLQKHPKVQQLVSVLPLAIMTLLLVHTLMSNTHDNPHGPWAEWVAVTVALGFAGWQRHALLSILLATALYVLLRNTT